jgi:DNA-binding PadR family transcriptional regulator
MPRPPTLYEHAILGTLQAEPASAYGLMQRFATTPLGHYGSGSPGAVYPALRRLRRAGLVAVAPAGGAVRGTRLHATTSGRASLRRWAAQPMTQEDLVTRDAELMLRFACLEHASVGETRRFLSAYAAAARAQAREVAAWTRSAGRKLTRHRRLALEYGVADYVMKTRWAERALSAFARRGAR